MSFSNNQTFGIYFTVICHQRVDIHAGGKFGSLYGQNGIAAVVKRVVLY